MIFDRFPIILLNCGLTQTIIYLSTIPQVSSVYNIVLSIMAKGAQTGKATIKPHSLQLGQLLSFVPRVFVLSFVFLTI